MKRDMVIKKKAEARLDSLGGGVLVGMLCVISVFAWFAWRAFGISSWIFLGMVALFILLVLYMADATGEELIWDGRSIVFRSPLQKTQVIDACLMHHIHVVFEGFNLERGIVSIHYQDPKGIEGKLPLGPLWRWRDLQSFFQFFESASKDCALVQFKH